MLTNKNYSYPGPWPGNPIMLFCRQRNNPSPEELEAIGKMALSITLSFWICEAMKIMVIEDLNGN